MLWPRAPSASPQEWTRSCHSCPFRTTLHVWFSWVAHSPILLTLLNSSFLSRLNLRHLVSAGRHFISSRDFLSFYFYFFVQATSIACSASVYHYPTYWITVWFLADPFLKGMSALGLKWWQASAVLWLVSTVLAERERPTVGTLHYRV